MKQKEWHDNPQNSIPFSIEEWQDCGDGTWDWLPVEHALTEEGAIERYREIASHKKNTSGLRVIKEVVSGYYH